MLGCQAYAVSGLFNSVVGNRRQSSKWGLDTGVGARGDGHKHQTDQSDDLDARACLILRVVHYSCAPAGQIGAHARIAKEKSITSHVAVGSLSSSSFLDGAVLATVRPCFAANASLCFMLVTLGSSPHAAHVFDLHPRGIQKANATNECETETECTRKMNRCVNE